MRVHEIHEHVWDVLVFEKRRWVILYIQKKTPHISVLQREIICLNRESGNLCFREDIDFYMQDAYQSHDFYENLTSFCR